jgi:MoaA/NifB/PqqE/SkfB family radical SAM enzyme
LGAPGLIAADRCFPLQFSALSLLFGTERQRAIFDDATSIDEAAAAFDAIGAKSAASLVRALIDCENWETSSGVDDRRGSFILVDRALIYDAGQKLFFCLSEPDMWFLPSIGDEGFCITEAYIMNRTRCLDVNECIKFVDAFCESLPGSIPAVIEAVALAASRYCCMRGEHQRAATMIGRLLTVSRKSIYLRAVEDAVGRLTAGESIPPRLRKFIGEDDGLLSDRFCPLPFGRTEIHQHGEVVVCCTHWVPTVIGNVLEQPLIDVVNSETAKAIRRSVVDGSFKYCSHSDCEKLINDKLPYKRDYAGIAYTDEYLDISADTLANAFYGRSYDVPGPSHIVYSFDQTCNLSCPSCRTDLVMVTGEHRDRLYEISDRTIAPAMGTAKRIMVNPSGEVFVSRPSRRLLERLAEPGYDHVIVDIITNGSVCDKAEWDKFSHLYRRLGIIRVSLDAARKETFERLRRGACYETVIGNLNNLRRMREENLFQHFVVSFTYQRDNLYEMEEFVDFAGRFKVSNVLFEKLQNVGAYTSEEYYERAVHLIDHPLHGEFLEIARRVKRNPRVILDFDPEPMAEPIRRN